MGSKTFFFFATKCICCRGWGGVGLAPFKMASPCAGRVLSVNFLQQRTLSVKTSQQFLPYPQIMEQFLFGPDYKTRLPGHLSHASFLSLLVGKKDTKRSGKQKNLGNTHSGPSAGLDNGGSQCKKKRLSLCLRSLQSR